MLVFVVLSVGLVVSLWQCGEVQVVVCQSEVVMCFLIELFGSVDFDKYGGYIFNVLEFLDKSCVELFKCFVDDLVMYVCVFEVMGEIYVDMNCFDVVILLVDELVVCIWQFWGEDVLVSICVLWLCLWLDIFFGFLLGVIECGELLLVVLDCQGVDFSDWLELMYQFIVVYVQVGCIDEFEVMCVCVWLLVFKFFLVDFFDVQFFSIYVYYLWLV